ncbi:MAG TPA: EAL domain-containing protein [Polyangiaceae bacterium]|nr:EAL domain-containing protein [Polyangiaceae bacterium]
MADAVRGQARGSTKGQVLVVDDERPVARVFGRVLETAGYQTSVCYDGAMALSLLDRYEYDVVLSDLAMPGLDGIELLRAVRARDLDLPVILVTGTPSMDSAILAVEYGAHRYLQKPVDARLLSEAVSKAISVRRFAVLRREMLAALGAQGLCLSDRAGLEVRFERALEQLYMVFQPVVSWSARSVFAYEAFVRSREPTLRTPRELFDAAERLNRLYELTSRIHDLCGERLGTLPPFALLFVNLHVQDLTYASKLVETSALVPVADRVVLELTERAALEQVHDMQAKVATYRQAGFRIALDDIGAGYAGLNSFTLLDPDIVKLDNVLVRDVDGAPTKRRLVASMTKLCADLGMQVVAEGIETEREREVLVDLGCDLMQGFLFAHPADTLVTPIFSE